MPVVLGEIASAVILRQIVVGNVVGWREVDPVRLKQAPVGPERRGRGDKDAVVAARPIDGKRRLS